MRILPLNANLVTVPKQKERSQFASVIQREKKFPLVLLPPAVIVRVVLVRIVTSPTNQGNQ